MIPPPLHENPPSLIDTYPTQQVRQTVLGTDLNSDSSADSLSGLFSLYLSHPEKHEKDMTESWKAHADGILVFVRPLLALLVFNRLML